MNPIKEFFRKKKREQNFKAAGPGRKLDEVGGPAQSSRPPISHTVRQEVSEGAQRAGAAALARIEQKQSTVDWSLQATKAKAMKELEMEKERKVQPHIPKDKAIEDGVSGVFFTCPLLGLEEALPKQEMREKIKQFLYEQLEQERGLTACLILHSLNSREKVRMGVETLCRYLTNIVDNPTESKYQRIRIGNPVFQEKVLPLEGASDFLAAAGFQQQRQGEEEYLVFDQQVELETVQMLKEALLSSEPIRPVLYRDLRVLKPGPPTLPGQLPNEFFQLSLEEIKREQESRTANVELLTQLRTKAMRERDEQRELHLYNYTLIRIRFPDQITLQGTFSVHERLSAVKEFVGEHLSFSDTKFHLLLPGGNRLTQDENTLLELKMVPTVLLNFVWERQKGGYLRPELLEYAQ